MAEAFGSISPCILHVSICFPVGLLNVRVSRERFSRRFATSSFRQGLVFAGHLRTAGHAIRVVSSPFTLQDAARRGSAHKENWGNGGHFRPRAFDHFR